MPSRGDQVDMEFFLKDLSYSFWCEAPLLRSEVAAARREESRWVTGIYTKMLVFRIFRLQSVVVCISKGQIRKIQIKTRRFMSSNRELLNFPVDSRPLKF